MRPWTALGPLAHLPLFPCTVQAEVVSDEEASHGGDDEFDERSAAAHASSSQTGAATALNSSPRAAANPNSVGTSADADANIASTVALPPLPPASASKPWWEATHGREAPHGRQSPRSPPPRASTPSVPLSPHSMWHHNARNARLARSSTPSIHSIRRSLDAAKPATGTSHSQQADRLSQSQALQQALTLALSSNDIFNMMGVSGHVCVCVCACV